MIELASITLELQVSPLMIEIFLFVSGVNSTVLGVIPVVIGTISIVIGAILIAIEVITVRMR